MELALFMYLADVVGNIGIALGIITTLLSVSVGICFFAHVVNEELHKVKMKYVLVPILCGIITAMIPSERTMYMVLAGYSTQHVIQSDTAETTKKVVDAKLDDYLNEIQSKGDKK